MQEFLLEWCTMQNGKIGLKLNSKTIKYYCSIANAKQYTLTVSNDSARGLLMYGVSSPGKQFLYMIYIGYDASSAINKIYDDYLERQFSVSYNKENFTLTISSSVIVYGGIRILID